MRMCLLFKIPHTSGSGDKQQIIHFEGHSPCNPQSLLKVDNTLDNADLGFSSCQYFLKISTWRGSIRLTFSHEGSSASETLVR